MPATRGRGDIRGNTHLGSTGLQYFPGCMECCSWGPPCSISHFGQVPISRGEICCINRSSRCPTNWAPDLPLDPRNPDARKNERVILSVDSVAFQPMITVSEDWTVDGLNHVFKIDDDLFDQFSQRSEVFVAFLKEY
jgi:hypothetical protein